MADAMMHGDGAGQGGGRGGRPRGARAEAVARDLVRRVQCMCEGVRELAGAQAGPGGGGLSTAVPPAVALLARAHRVLGAPADAAQGQAQQAQARAAAHDPRQQLRRLIDGACELATRVNRACAWAEEDDADEGAGQDVPEEAAEAATTGAGALRAARRQLAHVMEVLYYLDHAMSTAAVAARLLAAGDQGADGAGVVGQDDLAAGVARFAGLDGLDSGDVSATQLQQLLLFLLNEAQTRGYRRYCGVDCYTRRLTPGGLDCRAWTRACSIRDFVYDATRKELNFEQWINLTHGRGNAQAAIEHLANCADVQFPDLVKSRTVFAFENGVYLANAAAPGEPPSDRFVPAHAVDATVPQTVAACKYFDGLFPEAAAAAAAAGDWYDIPTPHLQSILDYQKFAPEVARWMYVFIGRLIYGVGELDRWQVMPYLKGQASSGKSTILMSVCRSLFEPQDVGVVSNNMERKFGLSAFSDKFMFVAPEIKADLQMEQAEFQSIVSGEAVQVNIKFKRAEPVEWSVPGIMAGNEVPGWIDNSGSISRRIVLFQFLISVSQGDTELGRKLAREMPAILLKANRAYHAAVRRVGTDNVWKHLPEYFALTKAELTENADPLTHFLNSGKLKFTASRDVYMPFETFKTMLYRHLKDNNFPTMRLGKEKCISPLMERGVDVEQARTRLGNDQSRLYPRAGPAARMMADRTWLVGVDVDDAYFGGGGVVGAGAGGASGSGVGGGVGMAHGDAMANLTGAGPMVLT